MTTREKRIDKLINRFYGEALFFDDLPLQAQKEVVIHTGRRLNICLCFQKGRQKLLIG